ncbi:hypothetical protein [Nostoc sp.]
MLNAAASLINLQVLWTQPATVVDSTVSATVSGSHRQAVNSHQVTR